MYCRVQRVHAGAVPMGKTAAAVSCWNLAASRVPLCVKLILVVVVVGGGHGVAYRSAVAG